MERTLEHLLARKAELKEELEVVTKKLKAVNKEIYRLEHPSKMAEIQAVADERRARVVALYEELGSYKKVAEIEGISAGRISQIMAKHRRILLYQETRRLQQESAQKSEP